VTNQIQPRSYSMVKIFQCVDKWDQFGRRETRSPV
jgi:hypothetical protein